MPCRDGGPTDAERSSDYRRKVDHLTRMLCEVLKTLTSSEIAALSRETQVWWTNHQEVDRRRLEREKQARETERKRKAAKAKLSPEEIRLLGL